jgi:hypothetical protein
MRRLIDTPPEEMELHLRLANLRMYLNRTNLSDLDFARCSEALKDLWRDWNRPHEKEER